MKQYAYPTADVEARALAIRSEIGDDPLYLTLLSNLTTLAHRCRFALGPGGSLAARYLDLPFAAVSFYGEGADLRTTLSKVLGAGELCYALLGEEQQAQLSPVTHVVRLYPEWQMVYLGDPAALEPGDAVPLVAADFPAMQALAARGGVMAFEANALEKGPYCGVWRDERLASMAGTHLTLERMAEIGNVATDPDYRRQGLATMTVSATTVALRAEGMLVVLQVLKSNIAAVAFYEKVGFVRSRSMCLIQFEL